MKNNKSNSNSKYKSLPQEEEKNDINNKKSSAITIKVKKGWKGKGRKNATNYFLCDKDFKAKSNARTLRHPEHSISSKKWLFAFFRYQKLDFVYVSEKKKKKTSTTQLFGILGSSHNYCLGHIVVKLIA